MTNTTQLLPVLLNSELYSGPFIALFNHADMLVKVLPPEDQDKKDRWSNVISLLEQSML